MRYSIQFIRNDTNILVRAERGVESANSTLAEWVLGLYKEKICHPTYQVAIYGTDDIKNCESFPYVEGGHVQALNFNNGDGKWRLRIYTGSSCTGNSEEVNNVNTCLKGDDIKTFNSYTIFRK